MIRIKTVLSCFDMLKKLFKSILLCPLKTEFTMSQLNWYYQPESVLRMYLVQVYKCELSLLADRVAFLTFCLQNPLTQHG